jgi:hypothetical protein
MKDVKDVENSRPMKERVKYIVASRMCRMNEAFVCVVVLCSVCASG